MRVPVLDVSELITPDGNTHAIAAEIGAACREHGFFFIQGHGISPRLEERLTRAAKEFFALPVATKMQVGMQRGGRAWRGYFPLGHELTSGKPDHKEGIYFGAELGPEDPRVVAKLAMHGANLFPSDSDDLRHAVLEYLDVMTALGHAVMRGIALSLGLRSEFFCETCAADPLVLFRMFHYPAVAANDETPWGVGEHTDYGLLTLLKQDDVGGLQVKHRGVWTSVPVVPGAFVCNIGDMLDRMTRGLYVSTPHRVVAPRARDRMSFPFFFDPSFSAVIAPIDGIPKADAARASRWDGADIDALRGTYGEYLVSKVSQVFPWLAENVST